jgi:hypothetical protein
MHGFDTKAMAILWMDHVDGVTIFPKLPVYSHEYYKHWQRNQQRIQDAVRNHMKSESDLLDELNKRRMPAELLVTMQQQLGSPRGAGCRLPKHDAQFVSHHLRSGFASWPDFQLRPRSIQLLSCVKSNCILPIHWIWMAGPPPPPSSLLPLSSSSSLSFLSFLFFLFRLKVLHRHVIKTKSGYLTIRVEH